MRSSRDARLRAQVLCAQAREAWDAAENLQARAKALADRLGSTPQASIGPRVRQVEREYLAPSS